MAKFTQNDVWSDTLRLMRAHRGALVAIAGVFNFLPVLLINHFIEQPDTTGLAPALAFDTYVGFFRDNLLWFVLESFVIMIGSAAVLRLVFRQNGTVGEALWFGILLLPAYSVMLFLSNFAICVGLILLVVPGLYLIGRLFPAGAAMVAEDRRNPVETIRRAFALTRNEGWQVLGLYVLVALPGAVIVYAVGAVTGSFFILVAGQELGKFLAGIVLAALNAVLTTLITVLSAAVYRALAPQKP